MELNPGLERLHFQKSGSLSLVYGCLPLERERKKHTQILSTVKLIPNEALFSLQQYEITVKIYQF